MKKASFLPTLFLVLAALTGPVARSTAIPAKPNIIFILGDDVGIGDVACSGSDHFKTPNIDALAQTGLRFANAYAEPLCGPSRATILTGRYVFRTGATNQDATGRFSSTVETMTPKVLKAAGYASTMIGKWGQLPLGPKDFGFDDYLKFKGSGVYWNTQKKGKEYEVNGETKPLLDKQYLPDVMHQHLVEFITQHHDDPFYIYYSMSHIHSEILPTPDSTPDSKDLYADNIAYMDKLVGKLVDELEKQHLREKTLIVYFGDNGTAGKHAETSTIGGRRVQGSKGTMFEGGSRVPMVANWPGVIAPGKVTQDLMDSSDFHTTFAELAGVALPEKTVVDGRSFLPALKGEKGHARDWVFIELARQWYVLEPGWKLNQAGELFDMSDAPFAEKPVPIDTKDPAAQAALARMKTVLAGLNPAGGILDEGDGTGRHANKKDKKDKKKNSDPGMEEE
jgi:arylsulfatase A